MVESIGRNSGSEYDNLTAAILEMKNNSILKEKMNKTAKIIISVLSVLLVVSIVFNILSLVANKDNKDVAISENPVSAVQSEAQPNDNGGEDVDSQSATK